MVMAKLSMTAPLQKMVSEFKSNVMLYDRYNTKILSHCTVNLNDPIRHLYPRFHNVTVVTACFTLKNYDKIKKKLDEQMIMELKSNTQKTR